MNTLDDYIASLPKYEEISEAEEAELLRRAKVDEKAKEEIVTRNLRLVVPIARRLQEMCTSMDIMDIIMEGNIALIKAIDNFDPSKGTKLSTIAYNYIWGWGLRAIQNSDKTIRVPVHLQNKLQQDGDELSEEEVYKIANMNSIMSLEGLSEKKDSDGDSTDKYMTDEATDIEDEVLKEACREDVRKILKDILNDKEYSIFGHSFGIIDNKCGMQDKEVAAHLGIPFSEVRQGMTTAMRKIRKEVVRNGKKAQLLHESLCDCISYK